MIWTVYQWTGNKAFLQKYYPVVKKGLEWLMKINDKDGNLLPDGFGMMEIHGLNSEMIDVAAYTQRAFADAAEMATEMQDKAAAIKYQKLAEGIKQKINTDFWVGENHSYADFIGTREQTLHLIEDAIVRADTLQKPWAVAELIATKAKVRALPPIPKRVCAASQLGGQYTDGNGYCRY
ncbi:MAG: GH116 family glycosyl hydrolase [Spirosomataceae bacterium]